MTVQNHSNRAGLTYLSLFSGIEACALAWHPLGWHCAGVAEIEAFPSKALAHHYPGVPNLGDVTQMTEEDVKRLGPLDLIVFGSPCQDLSVSGKRKGLDGERSGLFFTAIRIVGWARKHCGLRWALWENVPGAFSSNEGRDFGVVVAQLAGLDTPPLPAKWGTEGVCLGEAALVEWAVLDAQWRGVAQRRRRVFALADFGDWAGRPPVLLEPEGMRGDSPPSRETGEGVAGTLAARARGGGGLGTDFDLDGGLVVGGDRPVRIGTLAFGGNNTSGPIDVATARNACSSSSGRLDFESETFLLAFDTTQITHPENRSNPQPGDACHTLPKTGHPPTIAFNAWASADMLAFDEHTAAALTVGQAESSAVAQRGMRVRRLTPRECERLQGMRDDYTLIPGVKADGPRYKALGNSMAVPVMRYIGERIEQTYQWTT